MKNIFKNYCLVLIVSIVFNNSVLAQEDKIASTPIPDKVKLQAILTPPYVIGPGDQLTIIDRTLRDVFGQVEQYQVTVSADGYISIPLPDGTQENLLASGATLDELATTVRELFKKTLKNPLVFVQINRYRPINVYIGGEVVKPGVYKIETTTTTEKGGSTSSSLNTFGLSLTQAIQLAGGLKPRANIESIIVTRGTNQEKKLINLRTFLTGDDTTQDINLQPGDAIYVHSTDIVENQAQTHVILLGKLAYQEIPVSIVGEAMSSGNFTLPNDATLLDAIGKAGGLTEVGTFKKVKLSRYDKDGIYRTYQLNLHDLLLMGATFDQIVLRPNDSIELVASKGKEVRHFFRDKAGEFISATVSNIGSYLVQDSLFNRLSRRIQYTNLISPGSANSAGNIVTVLGGNNTGDTGNNTGNNNGNR